MCLSREILSSYSAALNEIQNKSQNKCKGPERRTNSTRKQEEIFISLMNIGYFPTHHLEGFLVVFCERLLSFI